MTYEFDVPDEIADDPDLDPGPDPSDFRPETGHFWMVAWLSAMVLFTFGGWVLGTPVAGFVGDPVLAGAACAGAMNAGLNVALMWVLA